MFESNIVDFGPYRVIGMQCTDNLFKELWEKFVLRLNEIKPSEGDEIKSFGLCCCIPGVTDGTFQYIAGRAAAKDAPVPEGMMEIAIPEGKYVSFRVASLAEISQAWSASGEWFEAHPEWEGFCNKDKCDCLGHPSFEYYSPEYHTDGTVYVYIPIQPKG